MIPRKDMKEAAKEWLRTNLATIGQLEAWVIENVEGYDWTNVHDPVADLVTELAEAKNVHLKQVRVAGLNTILIRSM